MTQVNKQAIASAFGRAAQSYSRHDDLQRRSAQGLKTLLGEGRFHTVLDAGCGPGANSRLWREAGSHVTVQWCASLPQALRELYRVTRPGGTVAFTTLLDNSLPELNQAWRAVDERPHANRFLPAQAVNDALAGWRYRAITEVVTLSFSDALSAMRSLKGIGATHLHDGRARKPLTRGELTQLELAWPRVRGEFPLSYQLFHGIIERD